MPLVYVLPLNVNNNVWMSLGVLIEASDRQGLVEGRVLIAHSRQGTGDQNLPR